jgi:hypothetical protein
VRCILGIGGSFLKVGSKRLKVDFDIGQDLGHDTSSEHHQLWVVLDHMLELLDQQLELLDQCMIIQWRIFR